jgi:hypothetical protein
MKGDCALRKLKVILTVGLLISASSASAQYLGQMSPGSTLDPNTGKLGGYAIMHEDATAAVGSVRYGFSDGFEGRLRLGIIDPDGPADVQFIFGGDFKYRLWKYKQSNNPFDFSFCGALEYAGLDYSNVLGLGGGVVGSIPINFRNNTSLEPYVGLHLRYQHTSVEGGDGKSDLKAGLNLGAAFAATRYVDFTAELQIESEVAFMIGVDFAAF